MYTPYVSTQRDDRIDYEGSRDDRKQGELVNMDITLNAQAFINVSRKRICGQAHTRAQQVWNRVLSVLKTIDEPLWKNCVPECVYRGFCPEHKECGRTSLLLYKQWRKDYIGDKPEILHHTIPEEKDGIIINTIYEQLLGGRHVVVTDVANNGDTPFVVLHYVGSNKSTLVELKIFKNNYKKI